MAHYNNLTPSEAERLAILSEECGEVVQAIGKILRHGYESSWTGQTNRTLLEKEVGDVCSIIERMIIVGDINPTKIENFKDIKTDTIEQFLHHQNND